MAVFSGFLMCVGSWNLFCFSTGMVIADFNLGQEENDLTTPPRPFKHGKKWTAVFAIALYMAGFPTLGNETAQISPMPGFEILRSLTPTILNLQDHSRFWWNLAGVLLLFSISQLPRLKRLLEARFSQYLGKIAFSLYLVHEFCLILFGLSLQELMISVTAGLEPRTNPFVYWALCGVWYIAFTALVFAVAAQVERWVDGPSVRFARWLECKCLRRRGSV